MEFLITESQFTMLLNEQDRSKLTSYLKKMYSFTTEIVSKATESYNLNLKMLLTWGASVGGLMMPLDKYIRTGEFKLNEEQISLILCGVAMIIFFEGKRGFQSILKKIKEQKIQNEFNIILEKGQELNSAFKEFLSSLNLSLSTVFDIVAYSFLIPIITDLYNISNKTSDIKEATQLIVERLMASGFVVVSKEILTSLIRKIIKRFKEN